MSYDGFSGPPPKSASDGSMDPKVMNFIQTQQATEMLFTQIEKLTETCWDLCAVNPKDRLDSKQESCLNNCVGRYFDTANFVAERFMKQAQGHS